MIRATARTITTRIVSDMAAAFRPGANRRGSTRPKELRQRHRCALLVGDDASILGAVHQGIFDFRRHLLSVGAGRQVVRRDGAKGLCDVRREPSSVVQSVGLLMPGAR